MESEPIERHSIKILRDCIELQQKKSHDYQNPHSTVTQAMYFPRGLHSIMDIVNGKMLRIKSIMETIEHNPEQSPNFEALEDSMMDAINYLSFAAAWTDGKIPGQDIDRGLFNKG